MSREHLALARGRVAGRPPGRSRGLGGALLILLVFLVAAPVVLDVSVFHPTATALPRSSRSMTYCVEDGHQLGMTVFEPPARRFRAPAVVEVHGGGWEKGSRLRSLANSPVAKDLVSDGVLVASIDYRLAPRFKWPAQMQDLACAVRSLRAHAGVLGIDASRIGVWGTSAGGQLASLLGTSPGDPSWSSGPYPWQSDRVQAVADEFGPEDLTANVWSHYVKNLVRATFGDNAGQPGPVLDQASPALRVATGDPPFLVVQGTDDQVVPVSQSEELYARLHAAGVPGELLLVSGGRHGLGTVGELPSSAHIDEDVARFLLNTLRVPSQPHVATAHRRLRNMRDGQAGGN